jgi:5,10-methylenetetrahydromethanopterin reductase
MAVAKRIGVAFDGRAPLAAVAEQARLAEAHGAATLWMASHLFLHDPVTMASVALNATQRIKVALMAMTPFAMHPVFIAMSAAALDELHPGRVILSLGAGAPGDLAAAGVSTPKPLASLRESMAICRALFAGEALQHEGEVFRVAGRRLVNAPRRIPVHLAASGPQMLELAGAQADGVLISAATAVPFIGWCLDNVARGAGTRRIERTAIVYTRVADDGAAAVASIRRNMGFILRGKHHAKNVELAGTKLDQTQLFDAYRDEDWPTVERLVTDEVVRAHAAAGTAEQVRARYAEYARIGLDEIVIGGIDDTRELERALQAVLR